ncbi:MAG: NifU family protein [Deltaproteobacteria bacterium]|nr:NifU family protein [Deltaproteobacteria bacterium]
MTSPAAIDTVPTPNPDALMFKVQESLIPTGTYEFKSMAQASDAPLPRRLFDIPGVQSVLVAPRFVTVNKDVDTPWPIIVPTIKDAIRDFLDSGDMAVPEDGLPVDAPIDEMGMKVVALLDEFIRPAIAQDGGDILFRGIDDGVVLVKLIGSCGTCPSSTATLAMGVERMLLEEIPELRGVRQVE